MTIIMFSKKAIRNIIAVVVWVAVWFVIAYLTNNKLLVASPVDTAVALFKMMSQKEFYCSIGGSLLRISLGFIAGIMTAGLLAVVSYKHPMLKALIAPFIGICKSMPVAVFAVILIIWWGPENLAFFISMIVVIPLIYTNLLEGLMATDRKLLQMMNVFRAPQRNKVMFVYRPQIESYLSGAVKTAVGMSWKAGVAAEVIGLTNMSIGGGLYSSKVYFETAEVFGWAIVVIIISFIMERLFMAVVSGILRYRVSCATVKAEVSGEGNVVLSNVNKSFDDRIVYQNYSEEFRSGEQYIISKASGSGKTTLLGMMAGLILPDSGTIKIDGNVSMLFQEDRLCEDYSAVVNVAMTGIGEDNARRALLQVLDEESIDRPCRELSGGMKRRVAIVRAVEYPASVLLLDEPYTGMDEETINTVKKYIDEHKKAKTVIMATHIL